jgi:hypothetical protein
MDEAREPARRRVIARLHCCPVRKHHACRTARTVASQRDDIQGCRRQRRKTVSLRSRLALLSNFIERSIQNGRRFIPFRVEFKSALSML